VVNVFSQIALRLGALLTRSMSMFRSGQIGKLLFQFSIGMAAQMRYDAATFFLVLQFGLDRRPTCSSSYFA
jgi:hypothetical protein